LFPFASNFGWYIPFLNFQLNVMLLRKKLRKAYVLYTVFRKPKEIILSTPLSGNLHPSVLINLLSPPLMELLVVSLWVGMVLSLMVKLLR